MTHRLIFRIVLCCFVVFLLAIVGPASAAAPTITGITPAFGPLAGGTVVNITGTDFTDSSTVYFGGYYGINVTYISPTQLSAESPVYYEYTTVDIVVYTTDGYSSTSSADQFTYADTPTVTGIDPASGSQLGGTLVTITGTGFTGTSTVRFGSADATSVTDYSDTQLTAVSPAGTGTVDVTVNSSPAGTSATSDADQFSYALTPTAAFNGTPTSGTAPLHISFTDNSTGSPASWNWSFGDGTFARIQNPAHTYYHSGLYTVSLTATNGAGSNTITKTGYINVTGYGSATGLPLSPGDSIQMAINNAGVGDTITLNPGIYYENGIIFTQDVNIRANPAVGGNSANTIIDGTGGQSGIFSSPASITPAITISNLTLRNGYSYSSAAHSGGAVYAGGNVTVTGSTFSNCTGYSTGYGTYGAGAIYSAASATVTSSTFSNCSGYGTYGAGAAIYSAASATVTSSTFSNCSGNGAYAIYSVYVTVTGSTFSNCDSGAIVGSYVSVTSSTFSNCSATAGGAITAYVSATVTSSTFSNCSATGDGGAIFLDGRYSDLAVTSSTFSNCSAMSSGGAIAAPDGSYAQINVTSSTFSNCSAMSYGGGAIYDGQYSSVTVANTTISYCAATGDGGAIYDGQYSSVTVANTTISYCTATGSGGAIYGGDYTFITVANTTISYCAATGSGGAIVGSAMVTNSTIANCTAAGSGGAIDGSAMVTNSTIANCTATTNGGAISSSDAVTVTGSTIANCSVTGDYGMGGAIGSNGAGSVNVTGSTISGCSALGNGGRGGAVYGNSGTIQHSRLLNNNDNTGKSVVTYSTSGVINATENWWGSNSNPSALVTGPTSYSPWLVLGITATPTSLTTAAVRANLTYDSDGNYNDPALGSVPDGIPVSFAIVSGPGSVTPLSAAIAGGRAQTTFTLPSPPGSSVINATVDSQTVSLTAAITGLPIPPTVTGITPNQGSGIGGTLVTITGTGFTNSSAVKFGTNNATTVTYYSPTRLTSVSPAGNNTVNVIVTTSAGTSTPVTTDQFTYVAPPQAEFMAFPTSGSSPLGVLFTDISTGSPITWNWSFGDGGASTDQNPYYTYYGNGNYTVSLTVTNAVGSNTTVKTQFIRVAPLTGDYRITLQSGWNFISTPKTLSAGNNTALIFGNVDCGGHSIWLYNASGQQWIAMNATTKINVLDGIWIYSATPTTVPLYFANNALQTPPTKMCYPGWNAIGFSDESPASARDTLSSVQNKWTTLIGFDSSQQRYESSIISGSNDFVHGDFNLMYPQQGYWVYMTSAGELAAISS